MRMRLNRLWSNITLLLVILIFMLSPAQAQTLTYDNDEPPTLEMILDAREEFEYEVRYGFLTLGWVKVELLPDTTFNGEKAYHMRTQIRSNRRIPFVGTRIVNYESIFTINDEKIYAHHFWRDDLHDDIYDVVRVRFDREAELVYFFEEGEPADTLDLKEPASGGDVVFYYSRLFAGISDPYILPVFTENEMGMLEAHSSDATEMRSYDAFDERVESYLSEGTADVEGPFGFRGRYKSWFATDDLRVPLEAHVRVIFGNVKVRLISYERHGYESEN